MKALIMSAMKWNTIPRWAESPDDVWMRESTVLAAATEIDIPDGCVLAAVDPSYKVVGANYNGVQVALAAVSGFARVIQEVKL